MEFLDRQRITRRTGSTAFDSGVFYEGRGTAPAGFHAGMTAGEAAGVPPINDRTAATSIRRDAAGFVVETTRAIRADR